MMTPQDRELLQTLEGLRARVQHVHGLVERFAAERGDAEPHIIATRRALSQLRLEFTGHNLENLAQVCSGMELAARRGSAPAQKARALRDGIGSMRQQIETAQRIIRSSGVQKDADER